MLQVVEELLSKNVTIVAATKYVQADVINNLSKDFGVHIAGENIVQQLLAKYDKCDDIAWHFIGQLQTNKVKYIIDKVSMIQSVDRLNLATEINRQASSHNIIMPILIEVNIGGETSKGGVSPLKLFELIEQIIKMDNIKISGLMTVMPIEAQESLYASMNMLFNEVKLMYPKQNIKYLSMGMSKDYKVAVQNGANMVRLGRKLFGEQNV